MTFFATPLNHSYMCMHTLSLRYRRVNVIWKHSFRGFYLFLLWKRFYLFILREKGREGHREGEKHRSIGLCPDWEVNQQPLISQDDAQPTELHGPGPALFTITKIWKQPKCPSVDEWIKQLRHIYIMEYYLVVKKEESFTLCDSMDGTGEHYAKWNKPVRGKQTPYDLTLMWNLMN